MRTQPLICRACGTKITSFDSPYCPNCLVIIDPNKLSEREKPEEGKILSDLRDHLGPDVDMRHIKEAKTKFFLPGEALVAAFIGSDPGFGFFKQYLIITDMRVIFWKRGITEVNKIFSYDDIGAAGEYRSILYNGLELNIKGAKEIFPYMNNADLSFAVNIIRDRIHSRKSRPGDAVQLSIPDQIRKLAELRDSGILTEQEFTLKKTELLKRL
jgi:hypothetical protein